MDEEPEDEDIEAWHTLVHVCRNWRNVVFGSPRRLNLHLCCTKRTPVRENLDIWPQLPIIIKVYYHDRWDNIFASLVPRHSHVPIWMPDPNLEVGV